MQKIYLKYDEYTEPVECDFGFVKELVYLGFLYPLKKNNYINTIIMLYTILYRYNYMSFNAFGNKHIICIQL